MSDMTPIIQPKSDQLNADDLIAGPRVITITGVCVTPGAEQPCHVNFEGDGGKPWKPCKTMGRVLVRAWGSDSAQYVGKSLKIFCDPDVTWAGMKVGGIRIAALSHIDAPFEMALTATRGKRNIKRFDRLEAPAQSKGGTDGAKEWAEKFCASVEACTETSALAELHHESGKHLARLAESRPELHELCQSAVTNRSKEIADEVVF